MNESWLRNSVENYLARNYHRFKVGSSHHMRERFGLKRKALNQTSYEYRNITSKTKNHHTSRGDLKTTISFLK